MPLSRRAMLASTLAGAAARALADARAYQEYEPDTAINKRR
jgi:hypothetical protein